MIKGKTPIDFQPPGSNPKVKDQNRKFSVLSKCTFEQRNRKLLSSRSRIMCRLRSTWPRVVANRGQSWQHQAWGMWHIIRKHFSWTKAMSIIIIFTCDNVSSTSLWALLQRVILTFKCVNYSLYLILYTYTLGLLSFNYKYFIVVAQFSKFEINFQL